MMGVLTQPGRKTSTCLTLRSCTTAAAGPSPTRSLTPPRRSNGPATPSADAGSVFSNRPAGHRGRTGEPLYSVRRVRRTGVELLSVRRRAARRGRGHLGHLPTHRRHLPQPGSSLCEDQYRHRYGRDRADHTRASAQTPGRRRAGLPRPAGACDGPIEAITGRLERLRGSELGFRDLSDHIARSRPQLHTQFG